MRYDDTWSLNALLTHEQKSPMAKEKVEAAFARLDKLCSGKGGENVADVQESMRQAGLFM